MASTEMTLTFRKAVIGDTTEIQALINSAFCGDPNQASWTSEAAFLDDVRIDEAGVTARLNQSNAFMLLAHDTSSTLVGCCFVHRRDGPRGYFGLLAVDPSRQAGGLGRKILAEAEGMARSELGIRTMEGRVIWPRTEMIEWYIRRGYTKTDRTEPFQYGQLRNGKAMRGDLYFVIMEKYL